MPDALQHDHTKLYENGAEMFGLQRWNTKTLSSWAMYSGEIHCKAFCIIPNGCMVYSKVSGQEIALFEAFLADKTPCADELKDSWVQQQGATIITFCGLIEAICHHVGVHTAI